MEIYTLGFTKRSAEEFFELINQNKIEMLIDIRLNNQSQLAGFTKGRDLEYFLSVICNCNYSHEIIFAPTKELLNGYKKGEISWLEYEKVFDNITSSRNVSDYFDNKFGEYQRVCLLCSEFEATQCHRRLLAEKLKTELEDKVRKIKHL